MRSAELVIRGLVLCTVTAAALFSSSCGNKPAKPQAETLAYSVGDSQQAEIVVVDDGGGNRKQLMRLKGEIDEKSSGWLD